MRRRIFAAVLFAAVLGGCGQTGTISHHGLPVAVARHGMPAQVVTVTTPATAPVAPSSPMVVYDEMPHWF